jgi:hypothetical protein
MTLAQASSLAACALYSRRRPVEPAVPLSQTSDAITTQGIKNSGQQNLAISARTTGKSTDSVEQQAMATIDLEDLENKRMNTKSRKAVQDEQGGRPCFLYLGAESVFRVVGYYGEK